LAKVPGPDCPPEGPAEATPWIKKRGPGVTRTAWKKQRPKKGKGGRGGGFSGPLGFCDGEPCSPSAPVYCRYRARNWRPYFNGLGGGDFRGEMDRHCTVAATKPVCLRGDWSDEMTVTGIGVDRPRVLDATGEDDVAIPSR